MRIIAGDVGGTKTLLQLVEDSAGERVIAREERFSSEGYSTFDAMLLEFIGGEAQPIDCACFAVAGPVLGNQAHLTNLGWLMSGPELERRFSLRKVTIVNDFYAVAVGIPYLTAGDVVSLNPGRRERTSPIAILGAGTGLGEAFLIPDETGWRVVPSEGGHTDFAPVTEDQVGLLRFVRSRVGRVSYERVLSGMGLTNIFAHLQASAGLPPGPETSPERIAELAEAGDPVAVKTLEMFVEIYGAEAGNLALKVIARGGVYLAGGIAGKHLARFQDGRFMRSFLDKGRFSGLVRDCPVDLIVNPQVGLLGASMLALRECGAMPHHRM